MKLCLIGWPLGHSLSPIFQNLALKEAGIRGEYALQPVEPEKDLGVFLSALRQDPEWMGANVTVPYKEKVIPFLDSLEGAAKTLRAVNTIVRKGDKLEGHNTDMPGFLADLRANEMLPSAGHAIVIGSGGAARAVVLGLVECGISVTLIAVIREQAATLASQLGRGMVEVAGWDDSSVAEAIKRAKLVVNCSPVGMSPNNGDSPWPNSIAWPKDAAVYDLVYNPYETRFLKDARDRGLNASSGLGMLVSQGALAFELWTGIKPDRSKMLDAALRAIQAGEK